MDPRNKPAGNKWDLSGIENYFEGCQLPRGKIRLSDYETIIDAEKFVGYSLSTLKANNGNPYFLPIVARLRRFKDFLEKK